jgi:3-oxoacyl-(acyl-carrier-protein) synthase
MNEMKRVVVTGMGVVAPNGTGLTEFLSSIRSGKSGIKTIPQLGELGFGCRIGGIPDVTKSPFLEILNKYNLADASSAIVYAGLAALEAWTDAGLEIPDYTAPEVDYNTGIIIGSGVGSLDIITNKLVPLVNEKRHFRLRSSTIEQLLFSASGAYLSGILGIGNWAGANSNACATGTESVYLGYDHIRLGRATRMVVGSTEGYSPYYWANFDALRVTSTQFNDDPEKGSRPMSATAGGLVPAAGAGVLILEELDSALARGAKIYAEICGGALNSGAQRNGGTMTAPNSEGVIRCIQDALNNAGITPDEIDAVSGHLSSTMADVLELKNWNSVLKRTPENFPWINSLKSMTGHCLGAAGSVETVAAVLELFHGFIHPSINTEDLHPEIESIVARPRVPLTSVPVPNLNIIAKTSFGFGDINACLIFKKHL